MFLLFAKRSTWYSFPDNNTPKLVGVAKDATSAARLIQEAIQLNGSSVAPSSKPWHNILLKNGVRIWLVNVPEASCVKESYLFSKAIELF